MQLAMGKSRYTQLIIYVVVSCELVTLETDV
jgi:hypothetical protein